MNKGWEESSLMSDYYRTEVCIASYEKPIEATRGSEMWKTYNGEKLEPPVFRRRPGRPTINRKRSRGEVRKLPGQKAAWLSRIGRVMTYINCGEEGHNNRTCKKPKQTTESSQGDGTNATQTMGSQARRGNTATNKRGGMWDKHRFQGVTRRKTQGGMTE